MKTEAEVRAMLRQVQESIETIRQRIDAWPRGKDGLRDAFDRLTELEMWERALCWVLAGTVVPPLVEGENKSDS